ncbi:MAG: undecaprenyl-phosphate glucose phosphotransferase [Leptothrix sp. (in: b-proteobacteria)]
MLPTETSPFTPRAPAPVAAVAQRAAPAPAARSLHESGGNRRFRSAPQSVSGFVATVLEPTLNVGLLLLAHLLFDEPVTRASMALMVFVSVLSFPGIERFHDRSLTAAVDIFGTWVRLMGLLLLCGYATDSIGFYNRDLLLAWAVATPLLQWTAVRAGSVWLRWQARQSASVRKVLVVGAGTLAVDTARELQARTEVRTQIVGYFDDRSGDRLAIRDPAQRLGAFSEVAAHVQRHGIDEVYITLPLGSQPRIVALLEALQGTTASLYLVPDLFGISIIQGRLQDINGVPIVGLCETPFTGINEIAKRISDLVLATLILLLIAPLLVMLAIGVKLSSPGPVIFKQRRNGLGGDEIVVYKFRSMRAMDDGPVVRQATQGDARITPFGAFIRRTSLDELPQFINVLQGRMSIVGPRPHAVAHNEQYAQLIKTYMVRHKVRPGITGWAQVHGFRGETDTVDKMKSRLEYDLDYLRNWSLGLDMHIIARTIRLVIADRNAY